MSATCQRLPGDRLHLQHGPIDLILWAEGEGDARHRAYDAAVRRFETVLTDLVAELSDLRRPLTGKSPQPSGRIARRMDRAARPFAREFITRMAAVAGAVADDTLGAMRRAAPLRRAYVNNGGDIALYLSPGTRFRTAISDHAASELGRITIKAADGIGGIATSGRHGRSHSLGIADSVTVLASTAAAADAAATMIANAVDLPGHPAIARAPAKDLDPDSDLGQRLVVTNCGALSRKDVAIALRAGLHRATEFRTSGHIQGAACFLNGHSVVLGECMAGDVPSLVQA